jgi:transposase-like protein
MMPQPQLLSSIVLRTPIEHPSCPKCQAQMMLARIVPAFSGTDLHTFECALCNYVLKKLGACEDWRGLGQR